MAETIPALVWISAGDGGSVYANERWRSYTGIAITDIPSGELAPRIFHPDDVERVLSAWSESRRRDSFEIAYRLRRHDGAYRWHLARAVRFNDRFWLGTAIDIHDQKMREENLAFLNEISEALTSSLQLDVALQNVADLTVPRAADWCSIYLFRNDRALLMAMAHRNDVKLQLARELARQYPRTVENDPSSQAAIANRSLLIEEIGEDALRERAGDERHLYLLKSLQMRSSIVAPLRLRDEALGYVEFANGPHSRPFDDADLQLAEVFAKRVSVAVDNARVFERERRVAQTFQDAALPRALPHVAGLRLSAVYEAAETTAEVGGDWYDAFIRRDGSLVLSIGDVSGKGLNAAVHMAHMRQAIRVAALQNLEPDEILRVADDAWELEYPGQLASAVVAIVPPDHATLRWSNAGHPPAFLRHADGSVRFLEQISAPLGVGNEVPYETREVALPPDSVACFYTDGLIESRRDVLGALQHLSAVAGDAALGHVSNHARFMRDAVLHERPRDDVAIVAVALTHNRHWTFDANDAMGAQGARSSFVAYLRAQGPPDADYDAAELIFGELVSNVVRYAPGPIDIDLEWKDGEAVLHIIDHGPGFEIRAALPEDDYNENGRGLFIIAALGRDFTSTPLTGGGSHVRVTLPITRR